MPDTTKLTWDKHPATFSKELMPTLIDVCSDSKRILDVFAGTGKIHRLRNSLDVETVGVEIEPEGANMSEWTLLGDATDLPFEDESFDAIVTSPAFANRVSDHQKPLEKCRLCEGTGLDGDPSENVACERCKGKGHNKYNRLTYRHTLPVDRELHPNNSGRMSWGKAYRQLHEKAWTEAIRVLIPQEQEGEPCACGYRRLEAVANCTCGLFVLNIKNHYRTKEHKIDGEKVKRRELQQVAEWHIETLEGLGLVLEKRIDVQTPGMRYGQNGDVREDNERIYVLRKQAK